MTDAQEPDRTYHPCCQHPINSAKRRKCMDREWRNLLPIVQRFYFPDKFLSQKEDVIQKVALYFIRNLCPGPHITTKNQEPYNPAKARLTTWLSVYHKGRVLDLWETYFKDEAKRQHNINAEGVDIIDQLLAPSDTDDEGDILAELLPLIRADETGILRQEHVRGKPHVNAQRVILRRVYDKQSWETLATEFETPFPTLAGLLKRSLPLLKQIHPDYVEAPPMDDIPINQAPADLEERQLQWAMDDPDGKLRAECSRKHPNITAQVLIVRRLNGETLEAIANDLQVSKGTLGSFYKRNCKPLIEEWLRTQQGGN
ncbi:MAG: hypothetical protein VKJ64_03480 [Leptolyngbyaceae bacterium]|nr:hypothetical protein [Leptolyngbyaceae bacterium]